jgi:hypothetical protein
LTTSLRWRLCKGALVLTVMGAAFLGMRPVPAQADEFCVSPSGGGDRFHLQITGTTTTTVGTVLSVAGIHRHTVEGDIRNPVTGTLVPEGGPLSWYRLALLETGTQGGVNLIWNARLDLIVGFVASNYLGPYTVDSMPAGTTLAPRGSGTMVVVNCQTGAIINF